MTPNIRYINQSAPFWDWIASFEDRAAEHPFFGASSDQEGPSGHPPGPPPGAWGPWGRRRGHGWHGQMPHHGSPPPFGAPPPFGEAEQSSSETEKEKEVNEKSGDAMETDKDKEPQDPPEDTVPTEPHRGRHCHGKRSHCGRGGPGRHGGPGGHGGPFGGRRHHPYGGWGGPRGGFGFLADLFPGAAGASNEANNDWQPDADVFDTETSFVVHLSLPGARKEDIGVSWDPEKSELSVSGVVHRPGDEAFLKTLALDERKTGMFERKIRLGTRSSPAQVDVDGISARLENGILIVEVPKLNGEFVEIKKVDIE